MKYTILWSKNAKDELLEIIRSIKARSGTEIAKQIYERIQFQLTRIDEFPNSLRAVPELNEIGVSEIKEFIESPWRIFCKIMNNEIRVLSIIDGRRNVEEILYKKVIEGKLT